MSETVSAHSPRMELLPRTQMAYVLLFSASGIVSIAFALGVRTRYDARGTKTLAYSLAGVGLWGLNSAARTAVSDPGVTLLLLSTEMFIAIGTARIWFIFASQYTNRELHRDRRVQLGLYGLVAAALVVPLTNPWHGLMWNSVTQVGEPFTRFVIDKGPAHFLFTTLGYLLVAVGLYFLLHMLRSTSHTRAIVSLIVGFLLLVSANATPYVFDTAITHSTTVTPLGATLFCLMSAIAIRNNLFAVTPVGRARVFTAIQDPVVMLDRNRRIIDHNPAFSRTFVDDSDVYHQEFREACPRLAEELDVTLDDPEDLVVRLEEGAERSFTVNAWPIESGPHRLGQVLVFRDISDLLTSQRELARRNSQFDEFTDSVAHDLRNPLAVITAHVSMLRTLLGHVESGGADYDRHLVANALDKLEEHSRRQSAIIDDFLKVTREAKSLEDVEPLDFERVVSENAADHVPVESLEVPVQGTITASPPHVGLLLDTIFRNVSHRATDDVAVTARLIEGGFVIEDTAGPIPPDVADGMLEYGVTTSYGGEGLGLVVAKPLAEAHRWSIAIDTDYRAGLRVTVEGVNTEIDASPAVPKPPT